MFKASFCPVFCKDYENKPCKECAFGKLTMEKALRIKIKTLLKTT